MLRVIAGEFRGRRIGAPPGGATRPTADRVRVSLFDLLGDIPQGARVLDVFAGSGALGIEALSRGALHCVFVEQSRGALRTLHENLAALSIADRSTVVPGDAFGSAVAARGPFDLVLADPPYRDGVEQRLVEEMGRRLTFGGVLALEHAMDRPAPETEGLAVWKARRYGGTLLTLYVRAAEENS